MRESFSVSTGDATGASASPCTVFLNPLHQISWLIRTSKLLWPNKTAEQLHLITHSSLRSCKYWLAGTYSPHGPALLLLLAAVRARLAEDQARLRQFELFKE